MATKTVVEINEQTITKALLDLGCSPALKGFDLLRKAIIICYDYKEMQGKFCSELYPMLAELVGGG